MGDQSPDSLEIYLDQLDEVARKLAQAYAQLGEACYVVRTDGEDDIAIIGPSLSPERVKAMLEWAGKIYQQIAPQSGTLN